MEISVKWTGNGMEHIASGEDVPAITIDGNRQAGPSPMVLLLYAVAACSAMDVVDILAKKRAPAETLTVTALGTRAEGKAGRPWQQIHITFKSPGADPVHLQRAADLSIEKYCSVAMNLRPTTEITYSIEV